MTCPGERPGHGTGLFLLAALLHDVGKAIDPSDHVLAALEALDGSITDRTSWLIAHHMDAHSHRDGTLGLRARSRLEAHEDFDDLMQLREFDTLGRVPGAWVDGLEEVLEYVRGMEAEEDFLP